MEQITAAAPTAAQVKAQMVALDPAFDTIHYGCRSFRDFLTRLGHRVRAVGHSGHDITLARVTPADGAVPAPGAGQVRTTRSANKKAPIGQPVARPPAGWPRRCPATAGPTRRPRRRPARRSCPHAFPRSRRSPPPAGHRVSQQSEQATEERAEDQAVQRQQQTGDHRVDPVEQPEHPADQRIPAPPPRQPTATQPDRWSTDRWSPPCLMWRRITFSGDPWSGRRGSQRLS